jgi:hypothetical protein
LLTKLNKSDEEAKIDVQKDRNIPNAEQESFLLAKNVPSAGRDKIVILTAHVLKGRSLL